MTAVRLYIRRGRYWWDDAWTFFSLLWCVLFGLWCPGGCSSSFTSLLIQIVSVFMHVENPGTFYFLFCFPLLFSVLFSSLLLRYVSWHRSRRTSCPSFRSSPDAWLALLYILLHPILSRPALVYSLMYLEGTSRNRYLWCFSCRSSIPGLLPKQSLRMRCIYRAYIQSSSPSTRVPSTAFHFSSRMHLSVLSPQH